jgi:hypothetical protein
MTAKTADEGLEIPAATDVVSDELFIWPEPQPERAEVASTTRHPETKTSLKTVVIKTLRVDDSHFNCCERCSRS